jgi:hypothetical protein
MVKTLVKYQAKVNIVDSNNQSPLFICIAQKRKPHTDEIFLYLIKECKAQINASDITNFSPIFYSIKLLLFDTIKIMLENASTFDNKQISKAGIIGMKCEGKNPI